MPEEWTGNLIGKMHNNRITYDALGEKVGMTKSYISMILNGTRKPVGIREKLEAAVDELIAERLRRNDVPISQPN